jgi:hypothetical protein
MRDRLVVFNLTALDAELLRHADGGRRFLTLAKQDRRLEHRVDARQHALGCCRPGVPDRLQHLDHLCVCDARDRSIAEARVDVGLHRRRPLGDMLGVGEVWFPQLVVGFGSFPEGHRLGPPLAGEVLAIARGAPDVDRLLPSGIQRDDREGAQAPAVALASDGDTQHPATRTGGLYHEAQAAAVLVYARAEPGDVPGAQSPLRPYPIFHLRTLSVPYWAPDTGVQR